MRALSRYVCVRGPQVDVEWHRMLTRPAGAGGRAAHANVLLLPWPLAVRARDFRKANYSLQCMDASTNGFFTFEPDGCLDLERVDAVLRAAIDEGGTVDIVVLPECAVLPAEIAPLEEVLGRYGVWSLITGVREPAIDDGLGANWVHVGIRQATVWRHAVQHKHHRWRLDGRQISQYHLGGILSPQMNWWEAVEIPRRSLEIIDEGAVVLSTLVCEDLARLEPVADLVRSIGPSIVVTLLLDGPQLASRWTARYASVLADDPGCAVVTLTSYGMAQRCRPPHCTPSSVVALWKDPSGELTEISLEPGADAVLVATHVMIGSSVTADGRRHIGSTRTINIAGAQSIFAERAPAPVEANAHPEYANTSGLRELKEREISKATSWAEAAAEAVVADPESLEPLLAMATSCDWRERLGLPRPSRLFVHAIEALREELPASPAIEDLRAAATRLGHSTSPAAVITGQLVDIALEQRLIAEVAEGRLPPQILNVFAANS
jgi:hypothetical protein